MRPWHVALIVGLCCIPQVHASDETAKLIHNGQEALNTGRPDVARENFLAALAISDIPPEDRFVAMIGLGRSQMWLGLYRPARYSYEQALELAHSESDREAAATGLARALNAMGRSREARAIVQPYATRNPGSALEMLKARRDLNLVDGSTDYLGALSEINPESRLGKEAAGLKEDVDFALSPRLVGGLEYQHDSDDLTISGFNLGLNFPAKVEGKFARWGGSARSLRVTDEFGADTVISLQTDFATRFSDDHNLGLQLGVGATGDREFLYGHFGWEYVPSDSYGLNFSAERTPIYTSVALADRTLVNTYALGAGFRFGDQWHVRPSAYHQDFSDRNKRYGGALRVLMDPNDVCGGALSLGVEGYARVYSSELPGAGRGYYNPADFHEERISMIAYRRAGDRWGLRAAAGLGSQTADGDSGPTYLLDFSVDGRVGDNGRLNGALGRSSVSSLSGGGDDYWNKYLNISLAYPF